MKALSNNRCRQTSEILLFKDAAIHSTEQKSSGDETGYESLVKDRSAGFSSATSSSSSSSSDNQVDRLLNLVEHIPSPTDVSIVNEIIDNRSLVALRIEQFSKSISPTAVPTQKFHRKRVRPIPDSNSDSTGSIAFSNHLIVASPYPKKIFSSSNSSTIDLKPFGNHLEYVHDTRFHSTTNINRPKGELLTVELKDEQPLKRLSIEQMVKQRNLYAWWTNFRKTIHSSTLRDVALVFLGLLVGISVSVFIVLIII